MGLSGDFRVLVNDYILPRGKDRVTGSVDDLVPGGAR
jgi:hypothetical protein